MFGDAMPDDTGLPSFDPAAPHNAFYRAYVRFMRTKFAWQLGTRFGTKVDPFLLRVTGGRVAMTAVVPTATLTTTGAKSAQPRTVPVVYFTEGDDVILIASSFGRDKHPGWYYNLKANPHATLAKGHRTGSYAASEVLEEQEHARLFGLATRVYAGYGDYRDRTAAIGRRIPILRLTPTSSAS
jgi:deazaflavin-dependent oxidoreductase (nitroreductase family)